MSRYTYELTRDHPFDTDSTSDELWHIVRMDDEADPAHVRCLCGREVEPPAEHWGVEGILGMENLVCHQCRVRHVAESGVPVS